METNKKSDCSVPKYEKPKLRIIDLAADEVLAVGCKQQYSGSARSSSPCVAVPCGYKGS